MPKSVATTEVVAFLFLEGSLLIPAFRRLV